MKTLTEFMKNKTNTEIMKTKIEDLFKLLTDWRGLPDYQLERRADIFFALYLEDLLKHCGFFVEDEALTIIPEFPAKHENDNRSDKIDYMVCSERKVVYVELKTDINSICQKQSNYLNTIQKKEWKDVLNDIFKIYQNTEAKQKYENLLDKLDRWIEYREAAILVKERYTLKEDEIKKVVEREVVYILPDSPEEEIKHNPKQIHFEKIVEMLHLPKYADDPIAKEFANALDIWKKPLKAKKKPLEA